MPCDWFRNYRVLCQGDIYGSRASFVVLIQLYSGNHYDVGIKGTNPYIGRAGLLNFSICWCIWRLNNGHTVVRFLPDGNKWSSKGFVEDDTKSINRFFSGSAAEVESFVRYYQMLQVGSENFICFIGCKRCFCIILIAKKSVDSSLLVAMA